MLVLVLFPKLYLGGGKIKYWLKSTGKFNIDSFLSDTGTAFYAA
jgi:hypothetical protein